MRRFTRLAFLVTIAPALVFAQATGEPNAPPQPSPPQAEPAEGPPPSEAPPSEAPPPPPSQPPAPAPQMAAPAASPQPSEGPAGQWVYTNQFGWLWMPYGQQYTAIPSDARTFPDQYVYYPVYGWRWVVAPWVYGYGPSPYWGDGGPHYFAWYAHPWFRVGGYWGWGGYHGWGHYHGWVGPRSWGARGWAGAPAYYRSGVGRPHGSHPWQHGGPHPGPHAAHTSHSGPTRGGASHAHTKDEHR